MGTKTGKKEEKEQEQVWAEIFSLFDKDHDGHITTSELGDLLRGLNIDPTQQELKEATKQLDRDGNGSIEYHDFKAYMSTMKQTNFEDRKQEILKAFRIIDKNNDKFIDAHELVRVLTCIGDQLSHEEAEEMIKVADINKDGRIDYEEFAKFIAAPFTQ
ncbi:hypothetical protein BsWGS_14250 [Bradybaena similaris]